MPIYVQNSQAIAYVVPYLGVTLQPAGDPDSISNVTSELKAVTGQQRTDLHGFQMQGLVKFTKSANEAYSPVEITINAPATYDESSVPRASKVTPASPVYFDALGQGVKNIMIDNAAGACELEFWGSTDVTTSDLSLKRYRYMTRLYFDDPAYHSIPEELEAKMAPFRFIKVDHIRGASPDIYFHSQFA